MAYEKQTWSSNELITADKLNHIEDGIAGKKDTQSTVSSPTASGTAVAFIDSISQNAQGVITPTKKTVATATTSAAGLMSAADKTKLNGITAGAAVTSVNSKTGAVTIVPEIIGAVSKSGDTMTGDLNYKSPVADASKSNNNVTSTICPTTFNILDSENRNLSRLECIINPNGDVSTYLYTSNYNTSGQRLGPYGIMMTVNKAGNMTYTFSHPEKAREALGVTGEEIPLISSPVAMNNGGGQITNDSEKTFNSFKFVDLYFTFQNGFLNAIRIWPGYHDRTHKFGFFAWNSSDNAMRRVAVQFTTAGRYYTDGVVRMAYGSENTFNTLDNNLYLYMAIGYKW